MYEFAKREMRLADVFEEEKKKKKVYTWQQQCGLKGTE